MVKLLSFYSVHCLHDFYNTAKFKCTVWFFAKGQWILEGFQHASENWLLRWKKCGNPAGFAGQNMLPV